MIVAELLGALAEAFAGLFLAIVQLVGSTLGIFFEFLFLLITAGSSAATERYRQRTSERNDAKSNAIAGESAAKPLTRFHLVSAAAILIAVIAMPIWFWIQHRRIQWTEQRITALAERFADQTREDWDVALPTGALKDTDAWGRPLEL